MAGPPPHSSPLTKCYKAAEENPQHNEQVKTQRPLAHCDPRGGARGHRFPAQCLWASAIIPDRGKGYFGTCTIPFNEEKIGGFIAAMMAGALAEEEFFGELAGDDCRDRRDMLYIISAARYHRSGFDCLPRLRPACRRLVRRHRDKIECVAQALLLRRTLTPDEVDELIA
jgi:hypothetical protein